MKNKSYTSSTVAHGLVAFLLENLHSKSIDLGLERGVSGGSASGQSSLRRSFYRCGNQRQRVRRLYAGSVLIAAGYRVGVYSCLIWYVTPSACACEN